jgi:hypothetical protein
MKMSAGILFLVILTLTLAFAGDDEDSQWGSVGGKFSEHDRLSDNDFDDRDSIKNMQFKDNAQVFSEGTVGQDKKSFSGGQRSEGRLFKLQFHDENKKYLKKRLDETCDISNREKSQLLECFVKNYKNEGLLKDGADDASVDFLIGLAGNETMSMREKDKAIQEHFDSPQGKPLAEQK